MQRVIIPEILDSDECPPEEVECSLRDLGRINRWFGGVATTQALIERVARSTGKKHLSVLEVAAGFGEVPRLVSQRLARRGITLDFTLLDRMRSHLRGDTQSVVANALALPFRDGSFDVVSCNLFAHHLDPEELSRFVREAARVSRCAVAVNDLVRHPLHLALVYAAILASAFPPGSAVIEIFRQHLFRMGVTVWKDSAGGTAAGRRT